MSDRDVVVVFGSLLIGAVLGALVSGVVVVAGWENDCQKVGAHLSNGKVYECRLKP